MNGQQKDNTDERQEYMPGRADAHATRDEDVDELLREWKRQHAAFGVVLVGYALLLSATPLIVRYPNETTQILCTSLRHFIDWRAWVLAASAGCLIAIAVVALNRRR
jgi:hypothetical protein